MKYRNIEYTMNDQVARIKFANSSLNASIPTGSTEVAVKEIETIIDEFLAEKEKEKETK